MSYTDFQSKVQINPKFSADHFQTAWLGRVGFFGITGQKPEIDKSGCSIFDIFNEFLHFFDQILWNLKKISNYLQFSRNRLNKFSLKKKEIEKTSSAIACNVMTFEKLYHRPADERSRIFEKFGILAFDRLIPSKSNQKKRSMLQYRVLISC